MFACNSPGQFTCTFLWASRNSWSRPGFTRKRTTLNAAIIHLSTQTRSYLTPSLCNRLRNPTCAFACLCFNGGRLSSWPVTADAVGLCCSTERSSYDDILACSGHLALCLPGERRGLC